MLVIYNNWLIIHELTITLSSTYFIDCGARVGLIEKYLKRLQSVNMIKKITNPTDDKF